MTTGLTETLCTRCGLCCDGSLFDDVELSGETETTKLEILGLAIDPDDDDLLLQPCAALRGTRCSIYPYRPGCCRTFECRLLQRAHEGTLTFEQACDTIAQTRDHVNLVENLCNEVAGQADGRALKERSMEASSPSGGGDDERKGHVREELARAMEVMEDLIRRHFLD